jgi:hypothetical protein
MRSLEDTVAELNLSPGETYRTTVKGVEVQFHRPAEPQPVAPPPVAPTADEEPSQFADMVMLLPWFDAPPPQHVITVKAKYGPPPPPDPPIVPPEDEVTE